MIAEIVKEGVNTGLLNARVSYPAIVQSFDHVAQTVEVKIAIMQIVNGNNIELPMLLDVPIMVPTVHGFHITMPIKKGDEVVVLFADRCIDNWFANGGISKQSEHRVHHISDAMAIIGINSEPNAISNYSPDDMVIRNSANTQKITFREGGDIDIYTTRNINVDCVDIVVNATGSATVTTPTATVNAEVTINGNTQMNGTLAVTGEVSSDTSVTAPNIIGASSVTVSGVELASHVHGGVQTGSSNTSPVS